MAGQVIQVPFAGSVNSKTAAEYLDPSTQLIDAVNAVYAKDGAAEKRLGVTPLATTQLVGQPTMGTSFKLISRGAEVLATDGDSLFSYAPSGAAPVWSWKSLIPQCLATRTEVASLPAGAAAATMAEGPGRRMMVYRLGVGLAPSTTAGGDIYWSLYDTATNAGITVNQPVAGGGGKAYFAPIVIYQGSNFFVFATDKAKIVGWVFDANGVPVSGPTTVVSNMVGGAYGAAFDATPYVGGSGILITYAVSSGVQGMRYLRLESLPALTVTAFADNAVVGNATVSAARWDNSFGPAVIWFVWEELNGGVFQVYARPYTGAFVPTSAAFAVTSLPGTGVATSIGTLSVEPYAWAGTPQTTFAAIFGSGGYGWTGTRIVGCQTAYDAAGNSLNAVAEYPNSFICGRPFNAASPDVIGGGRATRVYIPVVFSQQSVAGGPYADSTFLLDTRVTDVTGAGTGKVRPRVVAVTAPRQSTRVAVALAQTIDLRPSVGSGPAAGLIAGTWRNLVATSASEEFAPPAGVALLPTAGVMVISAAQWDFTTATSCQYAEGNGETIVSGGVTSVYDALGLNEQSFFSWPIVVTIASDASAGSMTSAGVYEYSCCFAHLDDQGLIQRSAFWSQTVTLGGSDTECVLTIQDLPYTNRFTQSGARPVVEIYRSKAALSTLYFVASVSCNPNDAAYATPLVYTDGASDVTIGTHALQPTTGGALDSVCPPSSRCIVRHVDRLWMIDDTGNVVWFSTPFGAGDAPLFNETLSLQFTTDTLTALASMDDKIVCFSAAHIWYVEGYGPPATGLGSDLTTAVSVWGGTGCADWRSVVALPSTGILFQGALDGLIWLLDRGLNMTCVGIDVQDWMGPGVTVLASGVKPLAEQAFFVLSTGYVATFDYVSKRWSRQLYKISVDGALTPLYAIQPVGGAWTMATQQGARCYQENAPTSPAPYWDVDPFGAKHWITTTVSLAHLKPGGLQGWGALEYVQGLARNLDPCDVSMVLAYDYGQVSESRAWAYSALSAGSPAAPGILMWRMTPAGSNGQPMAVRATFSDAPPTGGVAVTGRGVRWLGAAFRVSPIGAIYDKLALGVKR